MADQDDWTPGDVASMIANPFYAITIDEGLALPHEPMISEDDWVKANVDLIKELGPEPYLRNLAVRPQGQLPTRLRADAGGWREQPAGQRHHEAASVGQGPSHKSPLTPYCLQAGCAVPEIVVLVKHVVGAVAEFNRRPK